MRHDFFVQLSRSRPTTKPRDVSSLRADARAGDGRSAVADPGASPRAGASGYFEGSVSWALGARKTAALLES